jgi:hypothetical protein
MCITGHWRGLSARRASLLLGVNHAAFCIGCCWLPNQLMFSVGTGCVGWMLALGAIMAAEKYVRWGQGDRQAARRRVDCVVRVDRRAERAHRLSADSRRKQQDRPIRETFEGRTIEHTRAERALALLLRSDGLVCKSL